jgi:tetratricopeptide (TPR) repeat protein
MGNRFPWDGLSGEHSNNIPTSGPTVGHAATVLASQLGFSTILLSGVDLCMNAQGMSHTAGTPEAELLKLPGNYDAQVNTYAGNQAGTSFDFFRSIDVLDKIGQKVNQYADVLFNLNINAAAIPSIQYLDMNQIEFRSVKPEFSTSKYQDQDLNDLNRLRKQLANFRMDFTRIHDICKKAEKCVNRIYVKGDDMPNAAYQKRLDVLEFRLQKAAPAMLKCVHYYMSLEYSKLRKPSGFSALGKAEMEQWARDYYAITASGCQFFRVSLARAIELVELREMEVAAQPNIDALLQAWADNGTPGRILRFRQKLGGHATRGQEEKLASAESEFIKSLTTSTSVHGDYILSSSGTISKSMQSLRYLKNKHAISDLETYSGKLSNLDWPYSTVAHYIRGSIAELTGDADSAIQEYQRVIEDCGNQLNQGMATAESIGPLIEESLTNLTKLFLDIPDIESAVSTLGTLCELSPQYIPSYANLLDMIGQYDAAVDLLNVYLEYALHDWRAARQLANIHEKAGNRQHSIEANQRADRIRQDSEISSKAA